MSLFPGTNLSYWGSLVLEIAPPMFQVVEVMILVMAGEVPRLSVLISTLWELTYSGQFIINKPSWVATTELEPKIATYTHNSRQFIINP